MSRQSLKQLIREKFADQWVEDAVSAEMAAALARWHYAPSLRWKQAGASRWINTPYGVLRVGQFFYRCWTVKRDGVSLCKSHRRPAFFSIRDAGRAAGLLHLADGFGDHKPVNDGLRWEQ